MAGVWFARAIHLLQYGVTLSQATAPELKHLSGETKPTGHPPKMQSTSSMRKNRVLGYSHCLETGMGDIHIAPSHEHDHITL
jgi:hypothetical protein